MTTGINTWLAMEQPDLPYGADLDGELTLSATPVTDLRPVKSGPFAVELGGDDDEVLYFRTAHSANVFASSYIDGPVSVEFIAEAVA